jgi:GH24 family phage-related lysozyme (muramidase)
MAINYNWFQTNVYNIIMDGVSSTEGEEISATSGVNPSNNSPTQKTTPNLNQNIPVLKVEDLSQLNRKISRTTTNTGWEAEAANFIALKEGFTKVAVWDVNHYRGGYGSDKIFRNNKLITVTEGTIFTKQEAVQTLEKYSITTYSNPIIKAIGNSNWEKLNNHQKAALVSLGYNVGAFYMTAREYGRKIAAAIKKGDYQAAAQGILNGPKTAGGKYLPGLAKRRKEEAQLFLYPADKSIY